MFRCLRSASKGLRGAGSLLAAERQAVAARSLPTALLAPWNRPQTNAASMQDDREERLSGKLADSMGGGGAAVAAAAASAGDDFVTPPEAQKTQQLVFDELSPDDFTAVADMFLGGLWTRLEKGMREAEGEVGAV